MRVFFPDGFHADDQSVGDASSVVSQRSLCTVSRPKSDVHPVGLSRTVASEVHDLSHGLKRAQYRRSVARLESIHRHPRVQAVRGRRLCALPSFQRTRDARWCLRWTTEVLSEGLRRRRTCHVRSCDSFPAGFSRGRRTCGACRVARASHARRGVLRPPLPGRRREQERSELARRRHLLHASGCEAHESVVECRRCAKETFETAMCHRGGRIEGRNGRRGSSSGSFVGSQPGGQIHMTHDLGDGTRSATPVIHVQTGAKLCLSEGTARTQQPF